MQKITMAVAATALTIGSLAASQTASAAQTTHDTTVNTPAPAPVIRPADCRGTTGPAGCGPGWWWGNGPNGWQCYPC